MGSGLIVVSSFIATVCAGLFAGAALYITLVEQPARMSLGPAAALAEWGPSYRRATLLQAPLALLGGLAALSGWLGGASRGWLIGGFLLASVVPITLLVIMPTNRALQDPGTAPNLPRVTVLLERWGQLHAVRTLLSIAAFGIFVWLLLSSDPSPGAL